MTQSPQGPRPTVLPLKGIRVLDFAQYLSGPGAALRLADLGAEVIKVEPPNGDNCRRLKFRGLSLGGESALFQSINRGKSSVTADLRNPVEYEAVKELVATADVMIQNFRPGVIERLGLGYDTVKTINPRIVYGSISGFGPATDWQKLPGQDLIAQSTAGIPWLSGSHDMPPIAVGTSIADMATAADLVEGILACLVRRGATGEGGRVDVSLMESVLNLAFESFTTFLNTGEEPSRGGPCSAHPDIAAPYGIYRTSDGVIALSMIPVTDLAELLDSPSLGKFSDDDAFEHRTEILTIVAQRLETNTTEFWLDILRKADAWCAPVLTWPELIEETAFRQGEFVQSIELHDGTSMQTTRYPIRIDGAVLKPGGAAPALGQRLVDSSNISQTEGRE